MNPTAGRILSLNVGGPRTVAWNGNPVVTSIWKNPVTGRRAVSATNVEGDRQSDLRVHGGADKAVYVYAAEDIDWWEGHLGRTLRPGIFGENLTVETPHALGDSLLGDRWAIGSALFEVSQPRLPCHKLGIRMGDMGFIRRFVRAGRFGLYLRVIRPGEIGAGDTITVVDRPAHRVSVELVARTFLVDRSRAGELLAAPQLPEPWRDWVREQVATPATLSAGAIRTAQSDRDAPVI
jgi:MOSC domain-containing protein YiiM